MMISVLNHIILAEYVGDVSAGTIVLVLNHSVSGSLGPDFDWRILCEEHGSIAVFETVEYGSVL